jgi:hypothetical protein
MRCAAGRYDSEMQSATVLFLILLAAAHVGDPGAVDRPLSLFREERPVLGYTLFGLLALIGGLHLRTYYRLGRGRELFAPAASLVLLAVIALTPSPQIGHNLAAFSLLGLVFGWYAVRLYRVASPWLYGHLAVPPILLLATLESSYGVWQKSIIIYLLLAANLDCLLATGRLTLPGPDDFNRKRRGPRGYYAPRVIWRRVDRPPGRHWGSGANSSTKAPATAARAGIHAKPQRRQEED